MKFLPVLLAIALTADATPSDPGTTAIDFLEKVRLGKLNLEPGGDTALSAHTGSEKVRQIARRLDRIARDLGSDPLEIGPILVEESFAVVLIRKIGGFDPGRLQVIPIALVKHGEDWIAAPVPASFENAGVGYAVVQRTRLENWMLREQVVELEKLRAQASERMRGKIQEALSNKDLRGLSSRQVGESFLAACERRQLGPILGFLGGLADRLPDDWSERLKAAESAVSPSLKSTNPWRLLTAPEVLRVLVRHEGSDDSALISIACLDPADKRPNSNGARIEVIHLELGKGDDHLWRVNPPANFLAADGVAESGDDLDSDLRDAFPAAWTEKHPSAPQPTAATAYQALIEALRTEDPRALLALSRLTAPPATAAKACTRAAQIWWKLHEPSAVCQTLPLAFKQDETTAVGILQFFSAREPARLDAKVFYFEKSSEGWLWTPEPSGEALANSEAWVGSETKDCERHWQDALLKDCLLLDPATHPKPPADDAARECVEAWLEAIQRDDMKAALAQVSRLDDPASGSLILQNLSYEMIASRRSGGTHAITGIYQGGSCAAVAVKIDHGEGKWSYPLYPVVETAQGPRILLEIDLFASSNRGREFLNKAALERLQKFSPLANELRPLCTRHQSDVEKFGDKENHESP